MSIVTGIFHNMSSGLRLRNEIVIPAEAGIQVLNGSRAARATQKHNCGSRTAGEVLGTRTIPGPRPSGRLRLSKFDPVEFVFARAKTILPGAKLGARSAPAGPAPGMARAKSTQKKARPNGTNTPMPAAMLGRAIREGSKTLPRFGFQVPVARAEYRSPSGGFQASSCSSQAAYCAADELASARSGEGEAEFSRKSGGLPRRRTGAPRIGAPRARRKLSRAPGRVSFGYFSLHKQRKVTSRGSATHKYASPKATQNLR
jgi:hypothetical protein